MNEPAERSPGKRSNGIGAILAAFFLLLCTAALLPYVVVAFQALRSHPVAFIFGSAAALIPGLIAHVFHYDTPFSKSLRDYAPRWVYPRPKTDSRDQTWFMTAALAVSVVPILSLFNALVYGVHMPPLGGMLLVLGFVAGLVFAGLRLFWAVYFLATEFFLGGTDGLYGAPIELGSNLLVAVAIAFLILRSRLRYAHGVKFPPLI